nr:MAG TPA: hypothetical protein [Caudoviricetes sp.]
MYTVLTRSTPPPCITPLVNEASGVFLCRKYVGKVSIKLLLTERNTRHIVILNKGKQREFPTRQKGNNNEVDSLLQRKEPIY